jgi:hypothetical protein
MPILHQIVKKNMQKLWSRLGVNIDSVVRSTTKLPCQNGIRNLFRVPLRPERNCEGPPDVRGARVHSGHLPHHFISQRLLQGNGNSKTAYCREEEG